MCVCVCTRGMYCIKAFKVGERKQESKVQQLVLGGISEQIIDEKIRVLAS